MTHKTVGADGEHRTYCRLCDAGCGMIATVKQGRIAVMRPNRDHLHSRGHVCVKGIAAGDIVHDPDRVTRPLKRIASGEFVPVEWDEALDDIAARLGAILTTDGPLALGAYMGNPTAYSSLNMAYVMGFLAACGSPKLYSSSSQDTASRMVANELLYGAPFPFPIPDLPHTDVLFIFGANPLVSNGSALCAPRLREDLDAIARRGRVVVFDPRRTETARMYEHVFVKPGSDGWLIAALLKVLDREGLVDRDFIAAHTTGFDRLLRCLGAMDMAVAARKSGVPIERIEELASIFGRASLAATYGRVGLCRGRYSSVTNALLDMLAILVGRFGQPGGIGFGLSLTGDPGGAAAAPVCSRIGGFPTVAGHMAAGVLAADITEPGPGRLRALVTVCGNPMLSVPNSEELAGALDQLDLLVSIDLYCTETSHRADYILPATTFLEREDVATTFVSLMVRPHLVASRAVIPPVGEAREEHEIFTALCERMAIGSPLPMIAMPQFIQDLGHTPEHEQIVDMMLRLSPVGDCYGARPGGLTMARLHDDHPNGFALDDGELLGTSLAQIRHGDGRIHLCDDALAAELERMAGAATEAEVGAGIEFRLIGRRNLRSMNSWMHNSERLVRSQEPTLLVHPGDAARLGLVAGAMVRLRSTTGMVEVEVEISDEVMPGVVSYPHGFGHERGSWQRANRTGGANINLLASSALADIEAISGSALLDGIAVSIEPIADTSAISNILEAAPQAVMP